MRIAILREFSGAVRDAFTARGHDATSLDLLPSETDGKHVQGDIQAQELTGFDVIIAHPPCTYLADGQPLAAYAKLANRCKSNMRAMLQEIESGVMREGCAK